MYYKKILQSELKRTDMCEVDAYDGQVDTDVAPLDDCEFLLKTDQVKGK
jgi:hypothetical protein